MILTLQRFATLLVATALLAGACAATDSDRRTALAAGERHVVLDVPAGEVGDDEVRVGFPSYPSLCPDGEMVVFAWAGDLWATSVEGGAATRLTSHAAIERRSAFSPDGSMLAFESNRDGTNSIYTMRLNHTDRGVVAGAVRRLVVSDRAQALGGFSRDGEYVYFSSFREPSIQRIPRLYKAPVDGGAVERVSGAFGRFPRGAADSDAVLFIRGRYQWERPVYRGSGEMQLYRYNPDGSFDPLATGPGNAGDGYQLPDGSVVFASSRDGQNNIFRLDPGASDQGEKEADGLTQLTRFHPTEDQLTIAHGVRDLSVSFSGNRAVFGVWDRLYTLDLDDANARPEALELIASADADRIETRDFNVGNSASDAAVSPDGRSVAGIARGELFVRNLSQNHPTRRVTDTHARIRDIAWSPCGTYLYFVSDNKEAKNSIYAATVDLTREDLTGEASPPAEAREDEGEDPDGEEGDDEDPPVDEEARQQDEGADDERKDEEREQDPGKRWANAITFNIEPVVVSDDNNRLPMPSPDGRSMLYVRGHGDLIWRDLGSGEERVIFESWDEPEVVWLPDSRHIVFAQSDLNFSRNVFWLDLEDENADPINLTRHPGANWRPRITADGKFLVFLSDRAGDTFAHDVWGIYLDPRLEGLPNYELAEHFNRARRAASNRSPIDPVDFDAEPDEDDRPKIDVDALDLNDAYRRVRRLTSSPTVRDLAITPGGDRIIYRVGSRLVSMDYRGQNETNLRTGSSYTNVHVNLKGDRVFYTRGGTIASTRTTGGGTQTRGLSARVTVDIPTQQRQKFNEASAVIRDRFYHPTLKDLDWSGISERYRDLAVSTRTSYEFNRVVNMLFGELDGSHLGIRGGDDFSTSSNRIGYLGIDVEPVAGGYRVTHITKGTPADAAISRLYEGDVILAVNNRRVAEDGESMPRIDLHHALDGTRGEETLLEIAREGHNSPAYVLITPISYGALNDLRYEEEVQQRRAMVEELSDGRLGYLHIPRMRMPQVRDYERDLFAAADGKEALLIDVRDNGGGRTADFLLASLMAPNHAYTVPRGADREDAAPYSYPRDRRFIFGYARPVNVLINFNSFSNAEIFSHAVRTMERGRLVGTATFGGVISTGSTSLIDGSTVRTPHRGWYLPDGTDMENNGAQPHIDVPMRPWHEDAGEDPQLEAAVRDLLEQLDKD